MGRFIFFLKHKKGNISILTAFLLPVLMGMAGLVMDVGIWYHQKTTLQTIADIVAVGGLRALNATGSSALAAAAASDAARNGFVADANKTIIINNPPTSGVDAGKSTAVEVILTEKATLYVSGYFMKQTPTITARSVASGGTTTQSACAVGLGGGVSAQGNATVQMTGCGVFSNANISTTGGATITAPTIGAVGRVTGNVTATLANGLTSGDAVIADPYAGLAIPSYSGCTQSDFSSNTTQTLSPGVYCNGFSLKAKAKITLNPGVYIIDRGAFSINGQATMTGTGVTFVFTSSTGSNYPTITINGGATLNLSAPTSGVYKGILFYIDGRSPNNSANFGGGASATLNGVIYAPSNAVTMAGNAATSSGTSCLQIVAWGVTISGASTLGAGCANSPTTNISVGGPISIVE